MPNTEIEEEERIQAHSKTGIIPRPNFEPLIARESQRPKPEAPEVRDEGSTTGIMPIITEGEDDSAERDNDAVAGS